jgi:four helix bundle protein
MTRTIDDLEIMKTAAELSDAVWSFVVKWRHFERDTIGKQLVRSIDSIGANIAEAYGRFHYGEKLNHLYYSRGSLFEAKFWLTRAEQRGLLAQEETQPLLEKLGALAIQLNGFARFVKSKRTVKEEAAPYITKTEEYADEEIYSSTEIQFLITNR